MRLVSRFIVILLCAVWGSQVFGQTTVTEPPRWESDIARFEAYDREKPPLQGSVLFVGSSSVAMWETLEKDFPRLTVLNRGIGGSALYDHVRSAHRLVLPYKPPIVVLYAGENDLVEGQTPAQVLHNFERFTSIVHAKLPATRIIFVSIKPSVARENLTDKFRETNSLIKHVIRNDSRLSYVDVFTPMLDPSGKPRPELFIADGLHMNARGYTLWANLITPQIYKRQALSDHH